MSYLLDVTCNLFLSFDLSFFYYITDKALNHNIKLTDNTGLMFGEKRGVEQTNELHRVS